jgi:hypothetical protein
MDSQHKLTCPFAAARGGAVATDAADAALPRLSRLSEVERDAPPDSAMRCIATWVRQFLARPHPDVGRRGAVCPFVPLSLEMDSIWMAEVPGQDPQFDDVARVITAFRDAFLAMEPTTGPEAMQKSILVVFPALVGKAGLVDEVQYALKKYFVDMGLMLGEFHADNQSQGLRNPDFRPLRSPIPMLAIRHMVESDLPFLMRESYPAIERSSFLRSYLSRMGGGLSPKKFELVLDRLIAAEIEVWVASAQAAGHVEAAKLPMPGVTLREARKPAAQPAGVAQ